MHLSPYMTKMIHKVYDVEYETKLGCVNGTFRRILLEKQTPHCFCLVVNLDSSQRMSKLSEEQHSRRIKRFILRICTGPFQNPVLCAGVRHILLACSQRLFLIAFMPYPSQLQRLVME